MNNRMKYMMAVVLGALAVISCGKTDPAQYFKPQLNPVLEGVSSTSMNWDCDDLNAQTLTLTGKDLTLDNVTCVASAEKSAFNINCNGEMIHVSPKAPNVNPENSITELLNIYVTEDEIFTVTLTQNRMDKPMILGLTPNALTWKASETDAKTIAVESLNVTPDILSITSNVANSHFTCTFADNVITVVPNSANEDTSAAKEETITVAAQGGNSMTFTVRQSKAPLPPTVLYESAFDVSGTPTINVYNANMTTYSIDGKDWSMCWACFTAQYKLSGKDSHILASVRKGVAGPSVIQSSNLLSATSTVTSFTLNLARRNANDGWCKVEYSYDGETWESAGPDFQALQSSSKTEAYTFTPRENESAVFMVRLSFCFDAAVAAHTFLNFDGVKVMGY